MEAESSGLYGTLAAPTSLLLAGGDPQCPLHTCALALCRPWQDDRQAQRRRSPESGCRCPWVTRVQGRDHHASCTSLSHRFRAPEGTECPSSHMVAPEPQDRQPCRSLSVTFLLFCPSTLLAKVPCVNVYLSPCPPTLISTVSQGSDIFWS